MLSLCLMHARVSFQMFVRHNLGFDLMRREVYAAYLAIILVRGHCVQPFCYHLFSSYCLSHAAFFLLFIAFVCAYILLIMAHIMNWILQWIWSIFCLYHASYKGSHNWSNETCNGFDNFSVYTICMRLHAPDKGLHSWSIDSCNGFDRFLSSASLIVMWRNTSKEELTSLPEDGYSQAESCSKISKDDGQACLEFELQSWYVDIWDFTITKSIWWFTEAKSWVLMKSSRY